MLNSVFIKAPAKLNLFLRILGLHNNGYHIIRTGITFIDLYDEVNISLNNINDLSYSGPFQPSSSTPYDRNILPAQPHIAYASNPKVIRKPGFQWFVLDNLLKIRK